MRFAALCLCFVLLPLRLAALCEGPGFTETLSDAERAEIASAVAATPYAEGLFWTARRDGVEITLIGTMHIHDPRHDGLMVRAAPAVEAADLVLLELTAVEEALAANAILTEPERLFLMEGPTLPEMLDEETWQRLADAARARQIPAFMAAKFRPWYLALSLAMPACAMPDLIAGRRGLDHRIMDVAEGAGVPMQALEPWDTLFRIMEEGTPEEQIDMLLMSVMPDEMQSRMIVSMLDGYFAGRIAEVWETSRIAARHVPGLDTETAEALFMETQEALLDVRNLAWIPVIEEAAAEHDRLVVAVGAAHLPGELGVLRLLEAEGWVIAPLT